MLIPRFGAKIRIWFCPSRRPSANMFGIAQGLPMMVPVYRLLGAACVGEDQPKRLRLASFSQTASGHFGITDHTRRLRLGGSGGGRLWLVGAVDLLADSQTRQRAAHALASRGPSTWVARKDRTSGPTPEPRRRIRCCVFSFGICPITPNTTCVRPSPSIGCRPFIARLATSCRRWVRVTLPSIATSYAIISRVYKRLRPIVAWPRNRGPRLAGRLEHGSTCL